jgi:hypothetical protein
MVIVGAVTLRCGGSYIRTDRRRIESLGILQAFPHAFLGFDSQARNAWIATVESTTRFTQKMKLACVLLAEAAGE